MYMYINVLYINVILMCMHVYVFLLLLYLLFLSFILLSLSLQFVMSDLDVLPGYDEHYHHAHQRDLQPVMMTQGDHLNQIKHKRGGITSGGLGGVTGYMKPMSTRLVTG